MTANLPPRAAPRAAPARRRRPRRALLTALLAGAALARPTAASPPDDEARRHFRAGVNLLEDPDGARYEEAYHEFKAAYDFAHAPQILGNIALCAMKLERDGEAIEAYQQYLAAAPDVDPDERAQVQRDLQTLGAGLARVTVRADAPGVRLFDTRVAANGRKVVNVYGPFDRPVELGLHPGHHVLAASAPGRLEASWEFEARAGARESYAFRLADAAAAAAARATPSPRAGESRGAAPSTLAPWLLAGVGGAAALGGALAGVVALQKERALADTCPGDVCPAGAGVGEGDRASLRTAANVSTGLLVGGGALAAVGVGWLLFGTGRGDARPGASAAAPARAGVPTVSGACGPRACFGGLRVAF